MFGRMTREQWQRKVLGLFNKPKVKPIKLPKLRKLKSVFKVSVFNPNKQRYEEVTLTAFTKGEARAELKKRIGKIPPGLELRKA